MFLTKPILTRREPLKRVTLRIKLHIPLIKDQVCYSVASSTTNKNANQRIYKGYKVARKVLIGIQYENVFKVIGVVHVILAFLKLFLLLKLLRRWLLVLVLLRRINVYSRS